MRKLPETLQIPNTSSASRSPPNQEFLETVGLSNTDNTNTVPSVQNADIAPIRHIRWKSPWSGLEAWGEPWYFQRPLKMNICSHKLAANSRMSLLTDNLDLGNNPFNGQFHY